MTVVSDIDRASLLEVIDSHKSDEIIEVLNQQPQEVKENVRISLCRYVGRFSESY